MILPGATLGILGGGQLGRMFVAAAQTMGYTVVVLDPDRDSPAAQMADSHIHASYTDNYALEHLARECAAITTEFENVPASSLNYLAGACPVRPSGAALAITQDRILEKNFLKSNGFDTAAFTVVEQRQGLWAALKQVATPVLMKSSRVPATMAKDSAGYVIWVKRKWLLTNWAANPAYWRHASPFKPKYQW